MQPRKWKDQTPETEAIDQEPTQMPGLPWSKQKGRLLTIQPSHNNCAHVHITFSSLGVELFNGLCKTTHSSILIEFLMSQHDIFNILMPQTW